MAKFIFQIMVQRVEIFLAKLNLVKIMVGKFGVGVGLIIQEQNVARQSNGIVVLQNHYIPGVLPLQ
mgnify:CR=1 FL=1